MANIGIITLSYAVACELHRKNELRTNTSCVSPTLTDLRHCLRAKSILMRVSVFDWLATTKPFIGFSWNLVWEPFQKVVGQACGVEKFCFAFERYRPRISVRRLKDLVRCFSLFNECLYSTLRTGTDHLSRASQSSVCSLKTVIACTYDTAPSPRSKEFLRVYL